MRSEEINFTHKDNLNFFGGEFKKIIQYNIIKMKLEELVMNEKENKIVVVNEEGKTIECDVLFTFESEETEKNYIVYTDNTFDENGNIKVYANVFDPEGEKTELIPIESDREWEIINNILETIQEEARNDEETFEKNEIKHGNITLKEIDE